MTRPLETLAVLTAGAYVLAGQIVELLTGLNGWAR